MAFIRAAIVAVATSVLTAAIGSAFAASDATTGVVRPPIPFRTEPTPVETHGVRVGIALIAVAAIAAIGLYFLRRRLHRITGESPDVECPKVLSIRRVDNRMSTYVIQFEGKKYLVARSGDQLINLSVTSTESTNPKCS